MKAYRFTVPPDSTLTQTLRFLEGVVRRHPKRLLTNSHIDQLDALAALLHMRQLTWAADAVQTANGTETDHRADRQAEGPQNAP